VGVIAGWDNDPMPDLIELTTAWIHGWAVSRGAAAPVAIDGGFRVDTGPPHGRTRYFLHTLDRETLDRLGREPTGVGTEIKVAGPARELRAVLSADWTMYPPNDLMTVGFTYGTVEVPPPYAARILTDGRVLLGLVHDPDGHVASSARLAVHESYGIVDQVRTHGPHLRRGLGRVLMTMLGNRAADMGLTIGVLAATDEGRALYRSLGWTVRGELTGAYRSDGVAGR
jgi:hypothetical protein